MWKLVQIEYKTIENETTPISLRLALKRGYNILARKAVFSISINDWCNVPLIRVERSITNEKKPIKITFFQRPT